MNKDSIETGLWRRGIIYTLLNNPKKIFSKLCHAMARSSVVPPLLRAWLHSIRGVQFSDRRAVFIGTNVLIDEKFPELVKIGRNVKITEGVKILTHFYDSSRTEHSFYKGNVTISDDVFIGTSAIISAPLTIGQGAIVAAGAVVTQDVRENDIVGGVPAKVIGKRGKTPPDNLSATHRN